MSARSQAQNAARRQRPRVPTYRMRESAVHWSRSAMMNWHAEMSLLLPARQAENWRCRSAQSRAEAGSGSGSGSARCEARGGVGRGRRQLLAQRLAAAARPLWRKEG